MNCKSVRTAKSDTSILPFLRHVYCVDGRKHVEGMRQCGGILCAEDLWRGEGCS